MDSILRSVFLVQICCLFELLTRFIRKMTLLVAMFAAAGCVYILESVFFLNVEPVSRIKSLVLKRAPGVEWE